MSPSANASGRPKTFVAAITLAAFASGAAVAAGVGWWCLSGSEPAQRSRVTAPEGQETAESDPSTPFRSAAIHREDALATRLEVTPPQPQARPDPELTDPAWDALPRGTRATWDFVAMVCKAPEHVDPARLFRHGDLNPGDAYLPPEARNELITLVERAQVQMQPMVLRRNHLRSVEVQGAQARGIGKPVESDGGSPVIGPEFVASGSIMTTNMGSGEGWVVSTAELPASTAATAEIERWGARLGAAIVDWFGSAGALNDTDRTSLLEAIRGARVERSTRR